MKGFAQQVRAALQELAPLGDITYAAIASRLDLVFNSDKQPMYMTLRDFIRRGECIRVAPRTVRYVSQKAPCPQNKSACMWRLIRANRNGTVTVDDLVAVCGVAESTAREYLKVLTRHGYTRRIDMPGNRRAKYQLINDPGPNLVKNEENAAKLRRMRAARKKALEQIDHARLVVADITKALNQAHRAVASMDDERDGL
jgi:hypothetical protein